MDNRTRNDVAIDVGHAKQSQNKGSTMDPVDYSRRQSLGQVTR